MSNLKKNKVSYYKDNLEVLKLLAQAIINNPNKRFGAILQDYRFVEYTHDENGNDEYWTNDYFLDPSMVVTNVKLAIEDMK